MNNELIPFNWEEYSKGGWEALYDGEVVTEVSKPDINGWRHFFVHKSFGWVQGYNTELSMRRKLRDAWVVVYKDAWDNLCCNIFISQSAANDNKVTIEEQLLKSEIHHIKTAL
jgi:hypothetical protein